MIDRATVQSMFDTMHDSGIDTDRDLLWGYFFVSADLRQLRAAGAELQRQGYQLVRIVRPVPDAGGDPGYLLHVERVETHDVDSLHERNRQFTQLAEQYQLDGYDGMDVGQGDGEPFA